MSAKFIVIPLIVALTVVSGAQAQSAKPADVETYQPSELEQRISEAFKKGECDKGFSLLERYQGDAIDVALFVIARYHDSGLCPPQDPEKVFAEMEETAEKGTFIHEYFLGYMHLNGIGTPKDPGKAKFWFKKNGLMLAGFRDKDRLHHLELFFGKHRIPDVLMDELAWVREVENSDPERLYDLALRLRDGDGLPRDCMIANRWLGRAAIKELYETRLAEAQYELGKWQIEGVCADKDVKGGLQWAYRAAEKGHLEAQMYLGAWYASQEPSEGVNYEDVNYAAYYWLKHAQSSGAGLDHLLEQVESRMTAKEKGFNSFMFETNTLPPLP